MLIPQLTGYIGRKTIWFVNHILNLIAFTGRMFRALGMRGGHGRAMVRKVVIEQIYFTAVQALHLVIPAALIIGSALIVQFARFTAQVELGKMVVMLIVRETGPMITAFFVILRSATAVTVEIGYMRVLHEFEAMEMSGLDPMRLVCIPRLVGISISMVGLIILFDLVSILGGYLLVGTFTGIQLGGFLHQIARALTPTDIAVGLIKALLFGITITATSLFFGFRTGRRITDIPMAASSAAVRAFLYCLVINIVISILFYL